MIKEQMNKLKNKFFSKNSEENPKKDKKKIENLVVFLIVLIVTLIAINTILKEDKKEKNNYDSLYKELAQNTEGKEKITDGTDLEQKIASILSTMAGVRESKCFSYIFTVK